MGWNATGRMTGDGKPSNSTNDGDTERDGLLENWMLDVDVGGTASETVVVIMDLTRSRADCDTAPLLLLPAARGGTMSGVGGVGGTALVTDVCSVGTN